ncbi:hypothetical protein CTI12_AA614310 [Artemisia annua]|uniref:Uncharacterized protein n=1 Tax=Artemisia annua TaxID=35608 RepID=A0A2U1KDS6_ARTAN|nr:hypothetical protein CTI12_AA614310 [Artemisia annua]
MMMGNANDDDKNPINNEILDSDEVNVSEDNENPIEENNESPQNCYVDGVNHNIFDLFKTARSRSQLANEGINDWKHLSDTLKFHENSSEHMINFRTLTELQVRLNINQTIDKCRL